MLPKSLMVGRGVPTAPYPIKVLRLAEHAGQESLIPRPRATVLYIRRKIFRRYIQNNISHKTANMAAPRNSGW